MNFNEFKLSKEILKNIEEMGYEIPTSIQSLAIPEILKNLDIIGLAQTGTGKTAAFSLPVIDRILKSKTNEKKIRSLIISPTRELAIQIRDNILDYSKNTKIRCGVVLGGVNQESQRKVLKSGIDILVATPGRLVDLMNQRIADISQVEVLVLDEADTMLDMGFIKDIRNIIKRTPSSRQTLLFSATVPNEVKELAKEFMNNPITIKTKTNEVTADKIKQELYYVDSSNKIKLLLEILGVKEKPSTLIFTRTKHGANKLSDKLKEFGLETSVIHGNKTQSNRVKALKDFKTGKTRIMIATDIASRGIDINDLELVVNYDLPEKNEIYVHRIGRTARAGKEGKAITLCSSAELSNLNSIERLINQKIKVIDHKYPMVLKEVKPAKKPNNSRNNNNKKPMDNRKKNDNKKPIDKRNYNRKKR